MWQQPPSGGQPLPRGEHGPLDHHRLDLPVVDVTREKEAGLKWFHYVMLVVSLFLLVGAFVGITKDRFDMVELSKELIHINKEVKMLKANLKDLRDRQGRERRQTERAVAAVAASCGGHTLHEGPFPSQRRPDDFLQRAANTHVSSPVAGSSRDHVEAWSTEDSSDWKEIDISPGMEDSAYDKDSGQASLSLFDPAHNSVPGPQTKSAGTPNKLGTRPRRSTPFDKLFEDNAYDYSKEVESAEAGKVDDSRTSEYARMRRNTSDDRSTTTTEHQKRRHNNQGGRTNRRRGEKTKRNKGKVRDKQVGVKKGRKKKGGNRNKSECIDAIQLGPKIHWDTIEAVYVGEERLSTWDNFKPNMSMTVFDLQIKIKESHPDKRITVVGEHGHVTGDLFSPRIPSFHRSDDSHKGINGTYHYWQPDVWPKPSCLKYNVSTGQLKVHKTGLYFIYSQITYELTIEPGDKVQEQLRNHQIYEVHGKHHNRTVVLNGLFSRTHSVSNGSAQLDETLFVAGQVYLEKGNTLEIVDGYERHMQGFVEDSYVQIKKPGETHWGVHLVH